MIGPDGKPAVLTAPDPAPPADVRPVEIASASAASVERAAPAMQLAPEARAVAHVEANALVRALKRSKCTHAEDRFAQEFVLCNNAAKAYMLANPEEANDPWHLVRARALRVVNKPHVLARIREYRAAAAEATVINVAAMLEADRRIVEGFEEHADQVTQYLRVCCRYCHGKDHLWQWIDLPEYLEALTKADTNNELRRAAKQKPLAMPSDAGGYGYDPKAEPDVTCPKCEGYGTERVIFADTTKLEGPARAIVKGVKVTANGTELLMHDYDKAKERLYRAAGAFGDDAASVARGAAAGAAAGSAAGAAAATRLAERAKAMSPEEVRRAYLGLVGG